MKQLAVPFQQLMQRRLWPLAVLLVAAAAALPFLLGTSEDAATPADTAPTTPAAAEDTTPIVARADDAQVERRRQVLGAPKDPFRPAVKAKAAKTPAPTSEPKRTTESPGGDGPVGTPPVSTGGGTTTPAAPTAAPPATDPVATPTPEPKPTFPLHSLVVRVGDVTSTLTKRMVVRNTGLPSNGHIGLVYKGVLKDHRTAVFWVVRGVKVDGDGTCQPGPENCQYVRLKVGETLFFTMPNGKQFELDLLEVHAGRAEAGAARSQAARRVPQGVRQGAGRYRYDWRSGVLSEVSSRVLKARAGAATGAVPIG